ncbi:hypothetical protein OO013_15645 [Mangrovivirga sp. M17]|uniref:DUF805 domain-containing protein n=1 Tax=Mangrovivirga halotolerans TaxID=2993936 RepID=A0ABT3RUW7_9BACT|nr:hypothetical protein [Mangrovivirga halotolerans]MCX2745311.1 hypothetical protein [Mangrovivirga halotolerans]
MNILDTFLQVREKDRSIIQIIGWWEVRRILYNLIVLVCGVISLLIMSVLTDLDAGEELQEPLAIISFAILCNLGYSLGWLTEIFMKRTKTYGPRMFKAGLYFTLFWVFIPAIMHIIFWVGRGFEKLN